MTVIRVRVRTKAKRRAVESRPDGSFAVWTTATPADGAANKDVITLVAAHLDLAKSRIKIARGASSRDKLLKII